MAYVRKFAVLATGLMVILSIPFSLQATPKKLPLLDRMVASVNDEAITESELNQQTQLLLVSLRQTDTTLPPLAELRKQLLEKMILEKLQLQVAKQQGIEEPDDATVDNTIKEIAKRDNLTLAELKEFLTEQGISFEQFRASRKADIIFSRLQMREIGQQVVVSEKEVEYYLNSPAGQDQSDNEYHLAHILIPIPEAASIEQTQKAKVEATQIVRELKAGANFAKVAMVKSAGQQALSGGDLGWRKTASIPTSFVKVVTTLQEGEVYGPIEDNSGFHIIKLLGKRSQDTTKNSAESARNKAFELLYQRKFEELLVPWLRNLRANAEVDIYLNET